MPGLLLILAFQAATTPSPAAVPVAPPVPQPDTPQRFSILVPVGNEPCVRKPTDDIIVCGDPLPSQKVPYPEEIVPDGPVPSNPYRNGTGALAAESTPCAVSSKGCTVGFGPPILPMVEGLVGLIKDATRKKLDKTGRVAIPLDGSDAPTGRLEP